MDLKKLSNEELAVLAQDNPNDKRYPHVLFKKNIGLLTNIGLNLFRKYKGYNGFIYDENDYLYSAYEVILIAIKNYHRNKPYMFVTYLSRLYINYVKREMFMFGNKDKPRDMAYYCLSLNDKIPNSEKKAGDDTEIINLIKDDYDLIDDVENKSNAKYILEYMKNNFSERNFKIFYSRFVLNKTLEESGKEFGVTRERARQIIDKMIRKFKRQMSNDDM